MIGKPLKSVEPVTDAKWNFFNFSKRSLAPESIQNQTKNQSNILKKVLNKGSLTSLTNLP